MRNITLKDTNGCWLAQVLLSDDGFIGVVSDYGNFAFAWRNFGTEKFEDFLLKISTDYLAGKIRLSVDTKCPMNWCVRIANKVLPALQAELKKV